MKDPTRIPYVLDELRRTWEGQPSESLSTLFGMLNVRGVGWGSNDEELVDALKDMQRKNPAFLDSPVDGRYVIETESPKNTITIDPYRVCVRGIRSAETYWTQPGIWEYQGISRCRTGNILVITDSSGVHHKLGVVSSITLINDKPTFEVDCLDGLSRKNLNAVYWVDLVGGNGVLIDHGIDIYTVSRREARHRRVSWDSLIAAHRGVPLQFKDAGGNAQNLEVVERIIVLDE